jgi:trehalose 6-phosphate synthase/phosphatase
MTPPDTPPLGGQPMSSPPLNRPPLNKSSAPIPVDGVALPTTPPEAEGLYITKADQRRLEKQLSQDKMGKTVPVWLSDEVDTSKEGTLCLKNQSRWRRFAEHELYNLFHYKQNEPTNGRAERQSWVDYYRMNQMFANKILEIYKPGDIVMIHDYHLLLLPSMLRQRVPHMYIVFYLHIPFPSSELLRCLPRRKDILEGVLSANLVGLQAFSYTRHFNSCCTRILGFPSTVAGVEAYGARCNVAAFPIGIDARTVQKLAFEDPAIDEKVAALRELYKGKKLIVGRDRLDSVRGVSQKLRAFERFLEMYPEWREKVVLVQVTSPTSVEEEREDSANKIAANVAELVDRINGLYGSLSFWPVQHYPQYLSQEEYLALLRVADVGLITSVRDGMNTTSLEYVVCQKEGHGPLIISEFSGSAAILESAIHINPWDTSAVATNIKQALEMSPEKKAVLHHQLSNYVFGNDVQNWTKVVLRKLLTTLSSNTHAFATPLLDKAAMLIQYRAANKRLFMFDYDGTLTPIVKDPAAALPSEKLFRTLKALAADPKNSIWIISGRDQEFLSSHLGHIPELGFSAEHGSFMRHPGSQEWENLAEIYDMGWQKEVMEVFQKYTEQTPGKPSYLFLSYRNPPN